jgi:hypothetical protein
MKPIQIKSYNFEEGADNRISIATQKFSAGDMRSSI